MKKIKLDYQIIDEAEGLKRLWSSVLKPAGILGLILIYGGIAFVTVSKIHSKGIIFIVLFELGLILITLDIFKRVIKKQSDKIDVYIAKFMLFGIIMLFFGLIVAVIMIYMHK